MSLFPSLHMIDQAILLALRSPGPGYLPIGPGWLHGSMVELSSLGSPTVLWLVVIAASGTMAALGQRKLAAFFIAFAAGGFGAVTVLKDIVGRPRPALVPHLVPVNSLSFPSGHAADSAIVYITLALIAGSGLPSRVARHFLLAAALSLAAIIGLTRLYLGVHWPSDVVVGWAFGLGWAVLGKYVARRAGLV